MKDSCSSGGLLLTCRYNRWWLDTLRVTRELFYSILQEILHLLPAPVATAMQPRPVLPSEQLAIFLYFAAHGGSYHAVAAAMGRSRSTVCRCIINVSQAIWQGLGDRVIKMPSTTAELQAQVSFLLPRVVPSSCYCYSFVLPLLLLLLLCRVSLHNFLLVAVAIAVAVAVAPLLQSGVYSLLNQQPPPHAHLTSGICARLSHLQAAKFEQTAGRFASSGQGLPQVVAAVDGSHIPIKKPASSGDAYVNRKGYFSVQLQGVCDADGQFINIYVGWPGRVHDARVWLNSWIGQASTMIGLCCCQLLLTQRSASFIHSCFTCS